MPQGLPTPSTAEERAQIAAIDGVAPPLKKGWRPPSVEQIPPFTDFDALIRIVGEDDEDADPGH